MATFEAWDPAGRTFDAVIAAQAWHWVDPVAGAAKAAQVLRPGGRLAVFWNVFAAARPGWRDAFAAVYRRVTPDSPFDATGPGPPWTRTGDVRPRPRTGSGRPARSASRSSGGSTGSSSYTRDEWLDQVPTPAATPSSRRPSSRRSWTAPGAAIDAVGGSFTMHYTTVAVTAARAGATDRA